MRTPRPLRRLATGALLVATVAVPAAAQPRPAGAGQLPSIPHETFRLPNGLTVLLAQDRTVPTVAVDVWYHVGSKNESAGRTGFAHLFGDGSVRASGPRMNADERGVVPM